MVKTASGHMIQYSILLVHSHSYIIKMPDGSTCQCHHDQLKSCQEQVTTPSQQLSDTVPPDLLTVPSTANLQPSTTSVPRHYPQRTSRPPTNNSSDFFPSL